MSIETVVQSVNAPLLDLHRSRVARQGTDGAGLFSHYAALLDSGMLFRDLEIETFRLIEEVLPAYGEYMVLRAGLGELAFLLNRAGRRVAACEPNAARFEALSAGAAHLQQTGTVDARRLRIAPDFVAPRSAARPVLGVATDFVFGLSLEEDEAFCARLRELDGLLINPRLFIRLRESPQERQAAEAFLRSLGFREVGMSGGTEMIHLVRSARSQVASSARGAAPPPTAAAQDFDALVQRLVSLAPALPTSRPETTWVDSRGRKTNLRCAFGGDR